MIQPKKSNSIILLRSINQCFQDYQNIDFKLHQIDRQKVEFVKDNLEKNYINAQNIFIDIIKDQQKLKALQNNIYYYLAQHLNTRQIFVLCKFQSEEIEYKKFPIKNFKTSINQILSNILLIMGELSILEENINQFVNWSQDKIVGQSVSSQPKLSFKKMIKLLVEEASIEIPQKLSQIIFRLYILEESIELILKKSNNLINNILQDLNKKTQIDQSIQDSPKKKNRSMLSQSIEIFIQNNAKRESQSSKNEKKYCMSAQNIKTDFIITNKKQVKPVPALQTNNCCFWISKKLVV